MSGKEIAVFIVGVILVVFLVVMKNTASNSRLIDAPDLVADNSQTPIPIQQPKEFQPDTNFPTIDSILDVPQWEFDLQTLSTLTSEELIKSANLSIDEDRYFQPENDNALFYYLSLKSIDEANENLQILSEKITNKILDISNLAISESDTDNLTFAISRLKTLNSNHAEILNLEEKLSTIKTINEIYPKGLQFLAEGNVINADNNDAWHIAKRSFMLDTENPNSIELVRKVEDFLVAEALLAAEEIDFQLANSSLEQLEMLNPESENILPTKQRITDLKKQRLLWLKQQTESAIDTANLQRAEQMYEQLLMLGVDDEQFAEYNSEIQRIRIFGRYKPLDNFADFYKNSETPEMVVMPTGSFLMGNAQGLNNEQPLHRVDIQYGFAVSKNEISVKDFRLFIKDTNYVTDAEKNKSSKIYDLKTGRLKNKSKITWERDYLGKKSKDDLPVIHISWNDALAYSQWLANKTGKNYRLLSESEFEYILRANTTSIFPWGDGNPTEIIENLTGKQDKSKGVIRSKWEKGFENYNDKHWGPAPVGSFVANSFGLNDTAGNVMEWVMDCWHDSYVRAPVDGTAWFNPGCENHVIRGGAWSSAKEEFSSSNRSTAKSNFTDARVGFRIALTLKNK